jgi:hypothetical protein
MWCRSTWPALNLGPRVKRAARKISRLLGAPAEISPAEVSPVD